jgi:microcystin-dependent protein
MITGIVVAFAGETIPTGWQLCDGRMLDKNDPRYAALFAVIGTIHGGSATPYFQLPDYRGRFLRGVDAGAGRDPDAGGRTAPGDGNTGNRGDRVGSLQGDQLGAHAHVIAGYHLEASGGHGFEGAGFETNSNRNHPWTRDYGTHAAGGSESRPTNASVHWIIKL